MHQTLQGHDEWNLLVPVDYHDHEVLKIDDLKFFVCPMGIVSKKSWQILDLVNETTDPENGRVDHLPYPGSYTEQPHWYREAVKIKRGERNSEWFSDEMKKKHNTGNAHGQ